MKKRTIAQVSTLLFALLLHSGMLSAQFLPQIIEPGAEQSETTETETVETVTEQQQEAAADPANGEIVVDETTTTEASADGSGSGDGSANHQAIVQAITTELNLFGATPEARTAFRTEAARNKGFIEAMKNVGVVSEEDTTTFAEKQKGVRSYEAASWNKHAIQKRGK